MTGIFDSGRGGVTVAKELRALLPSEDIILLCDRKNAPFGSKNRYELTEIATENIRLLASLGAERVLIGCCTASAVYPYLDEESRQIAIPIIEPIASAAERATENGKIGVIATEATIRSRVFRDTLTRDGYTNICDIALQWLVSEIEGGFSDECPNGKSIKRLECALMPLKDYGIDTLILGCTHFPVVSGIIADILGEGVRLISSAYEGAKMMKMMLRGEGRAVTKYIVR